MNNKPKYIVVDGEIINWKDGKIHLWSEAAKTGNNVFDSIRAYYVTKTNSFNLLAVDEHIDRLIQSAQLLNYPITFEKKDLKKSILKYVETFEENEHYYIRPTIFIDENNDGDLITRYYVVAFPVSTNESLEQGIKCMISSYRRITEDFLSARIKTGASYLQLHLCKKLAKDFGFDDAILLTDKGYVSETTGASLVIVKNSELIIPDETSDVLESITKEIVVKLALDKGIKVKKRSVLRSELFTADEIFVCGTLSELVPVVKVDNKIISEGKIGILTKMLQNEFFKACKNSENVQVMNVGKN